MCIISGQRITQPRPDSGDGITVFGWDGHVTIMDCVVDFSALPIRKADGSREPWRANVLLADGLCELLAGLVQPHRTSRQ